jgi:copper chaperone CopZ
MKNSTLISITAFFISIFSSNYSLVAQTDTTFTVSGNCGMCKNTIENALDEKGIKKASWDTETKLLSVSFNPSKINTKRIMELIAAAGYDTPLIKADSTAYSKLHSCCKYERKE